MNVGDNDGHDSADDATKLHHDQSKRMMNVKNGRKPNTAQRRHKHKQQRSLSSKFVIAIIVQILTSAMYMWKLSQTVDPTQHPSHPSQQQYQRANGRFDRSTTVLPNTSATVASAASASRAAEIEKAPESMPIPVSAPSPQAHAKVKPNKAQTTHAKKMPRFIIHVGPSKTATTTIQTSLADLSRSTILRQDHYMYWGRYHLNGQFRGNRMGYLNDMWNMTCMHDDYTAYLHKKRQLQSAGNVTNVTNATDATNTTDAVTPSPPPIPIPHCVKRMKNLLNALRQRGLSTIMSDEKYSYLQRFRRGIYDNPVFFENIRDLLAGWNLTVVVTYRRVFEWMLSTMKEMNGSAAEENNECTRWPKDGGEAHPRTWPLIYEWIRSSSRPFFGHPRHRKTMTLRYVHMDGTVQNWGEGGVAVHALNLHSKQHITQQLMCDFIDDAPNSCHHLRNQTVNVARNVRNMAWFNYNDIIFAAAERGLISADTQTQRTRIEMVDEMVRYHRDVLNKTIADLPLKCPNDGHLEYLLAMSLATEAKLMPEWYASPEGEAMHRSSFQRIAYERREFCNIDLDRLFQDVTSWDGLLQSMKKTRKKRKEGRQK